MTLPDRDAARNWIGRTVVDRDGADVGVCTALLADEATGRPEWLYAERGGQTVVVPLLDATGDENRVRVAVTGAEVDGAPRFGPSRELSRDQEAELYRHYGIQYSSAASDSLLPVTEPEPAPAAAGGAVPASPEPAAPAPTSPHPAASRPGGSRPRGAAAAAAALAAVAAVLAVLGLRRRSSRGTLRRLRRQAVPPPSAVRRARAGAAVARERTEQLAAAAAPVVATAGRRAVHGAITGVQAARSGTDAAAAQLAPLLAAGGRTAWSAARAGTDAALRATDAATSAVAATAPRLAENAVDAARTGAGALLAAGAAAAAVPEALAATEDRLEKGWRRLMGRVSLGLGLGVGYVLGARAGRGRYEQIKRAAAGIVQRPEVQQGLAQVRAAAPVPLRGSIDRLSGGSLRGNGAGGAPSSAAGARGRTGPPLPDPLTPPARSNGDPSGRS